MSELFQSDISRKQLNGLIIMLLLGFFGPFLSQISVFHETDSISLYAPLWTFEVLIGSHYGIRPIFELVSPFQSQNFLHNLWSLNLVFVIFVYYCIKGEIKRKNAITIGILCHSTWIALFFISLSTVISEHSSLLVPVPLLLIIGILTTLVEGKEPVNIVNEGNLEESDLTEMATS